MAMRTWNRPARAKLPLRIGLAAALAIIEAIALGASGCGGPPPAPPAPPTPIVTVVPPVEREIVNYEYLTGRVEAIEEVEIRARVSGYLEKIFFQPGSEVKKGDPLYQIDPRPFQTDFNRASAQLAEAEAKQQRLEAEFKRAQQLRSRGALAQEEYERALAGRAESIAASRAAQAAVNEAKLNLEFSKITAPISGEIGDRLVTEGNLVQGGQGGTSTLLTTIVSLDPIRAAFDMDEVTVQNIQEAIREGRIKSRTEQEVPVELGLAIHEPNYPVTGVLSFVNNQVNPQTGTIRLQARFDNPLPPKGPRLLKSGMFARVRIPIGSAFKALLVPDAALGSDQGRKYLYVVNKEGEAIRLNAETGELRDGLRVVLAVQAASDPQSRSLRADERVIVGGLQRVRPNMVVEIAEPSRKSGQGQGQGQEQRKTKASEG